MTATTLLPSHSTALATCAWCRTDFPTISALLAHVDDGHPQAQPDLVLRISCAA